MLSIYLSIYLSTYLSQPINQSIYLSNYRFTHPSIQRSINLSIHLSFLKVYSSKVTPELFPFSHTAAEVRLRKERSLKVWIDHNLKRSYTSSLFFPTFCSRRLWRHKLSLAINCCVRTWVPKVDGGRIKILSHAVHESGLSFQINKISKQISLLFS